MGKRELLLIVAFVVVGTIVYQITAPPTPEGRGVSASRIIDHLRREIRGNRATAEHTSTTTHQLEASITELRLRLGGARVAVIGEDRTDLLAELQVRSRAYDEAEALKLAKLTALRVDAAGTTLIGTISFPQAGRQTATLTLKVPSRLRVRVDSSGPLKVSNVAELEFGLARGDTTIERIAGRVSGAHRGGTLNLVQIGSLRLNGRSSDLRVTGVAGELTVNLQTGQLRAVDATGPIEVESNQAEIVLEKLDKMRGTMRVNAVGGTILIRGLRTDARIDGRNTKIDIVAEQAAPLAVYNDGDEDILVTPPPGGYRIDALAREGKITVPGALVAVTTEATDQRAAGAVNGGGPTLTLRTNRGGITLRAREPAKADVER